MEQVGSCPDLADWCLPGWNRLDQGDVETTEATMRLSTRHFVMVTVGVAALALVALVAKVSMGAEVGEGDGPVITLNADWNAYPTAMVVGRLDLTDGLSPARRRSGVLASPHHLGCGAAGSPLRWQLPRGCASACGEEFSGGGGFFSSEGLRRTDGVDTAALLRCVRATNADGAVLAYP
jgi:hypothetical protein